jgi:hypothetical protein
MKRISLLLVLGTLTSASAQAYTNKSHTVTGPTHPASQEWVLEQIARVQSTVAGLTLTATDWTNLCPQGQSLDRSTGCTPNCTGAQQPACAKMLAVTELEDQTLLSSTAPTGLRVFRLTVLPSFTNNAPTFSNVSSINSVRCQTFTVRGTLLNNLNDNFLLSSSAEANYQTNTAGVDLSINTITSGNQLLENAPSSGSQRLNQQYYVACLSYTITSNIATNTNTDGSTLSITWT